MKIKDGLENATDKQLYEELELRGLIDLSAVREDKYDNLYTRLKQKSMMVEDFDADGKVKIEAFVREILHIEPGMTDEDIVMHCRNARYEFTENRLRDLIKKEKSK